VISTPTHGSGYVVVSSGRLIMTPTYTPFLPSIILQAFIARMLSKEVESIAFMRQK
jgi:hypothetical protein